MNKKQLILCLSALFPLSISCSASAKWQAYGFGSVSYNNVEGFIQTPRGGDLNTTSYRRPSFEEMNIIHDNPYFFGMGLQYCDYFSEVKYIHINPKGSTTLQENLLTHAQFIPEGQYIDLHLEYDWYVLGFGKHFSDKDRKWQISPLLDLNFLKFHYEFCSGSIKSARNYSLVGLDIGLNIQHALSRFWFWDLEAKATLPLSNLKIQMASVGLNYKLPFSSKVTLIPRLSIDAFTIDYQDEQLIPNHFRYEAREQVSFKLTLIYT